ncbi:MAG: protein-L-isoaspartate O-methyltransferase [bacterium]|nr:protein-L-isoaspartate O-methyltransferase [bacterium]
MEELVENLKSSGVLKSPKIIEAFLNVDRKDFVPEDMKDSAYLDQALSIGHGQTISQPYTVAFMLELLGPKEGEKIMDIGYGSGWATALLAHIIGPAVLGGKIYAFELIEELCHFGEENVLKYPELRERVILFCQDASGGVEEEKFDGIISAAEVLEVPPAWRAQLKIGGRLVYPKAGSLFKEVKIGEGRFSSEQYRGFVFVPFVTK